MIDYSSINGTYEIVVPESIRKTIKEIDDLLNSEMEQAPCAYAKIPLTIFNLVDSEDADLFEFNVHKDVTVFNSNSSSTPRVLLTYKKDDANEIAFVVSGNGIDGYYVFQISDE